MCSVKRVGIVMGCLLVAGIQTGWAGDWYVKSGATGDGSAPDKPMPMLWKALDKAVRGDVIHVAQGHLQFSRRHRARRRGRIGGKARL